MSFVAYDSDLVPVREDDGTSADHDPYYFDVLPLHPPPRTLESYTGYLTRLAGSNGYRSVRLFAREVAGMESSFAPDASPFDLDNLSRITTQPEATLLATTFHYLLRKFGLLDRQKRFLRGDIAASFRFCPLCLAERGSASLLWRFTCLPGCAIHGRRLLDTCPRCREPQPLMPRSAHMDLCATPNCGQDLRACHAPSLRRAERHETGVRTRDLTFLLEPHPDEVDDAWLALASIECAYDRLAAELGRRTGRTQEPPWASLRSEQVPFPGIRHMAFGDYIRHADRVGTPLRDTIEDALRWLRPPPPDAPFIARRFTDAPSAEAYILGRIVDYVARWERRGEDITAERFERHYGWYIDTLARYPRVMALIGEIEEDSRATSHLKNWESGAPFYWRQVDYERRLSELFDRALAFICAARAAGREVTPETVAGAIGLSPGRLLCYGLLRAWVVDEW